MPTASEVSKLIDLFAPWLSATDRERLGATIAAIDWGNRQPLPQRQFGVPVATAASNSDSNHRSEQLQQRLRRLRPEPQQLDRMSMQLNDGAVWAGFSSAAGVAGCVAVRAGGFSWSRFGCRLCWNSSEGLRLARAAVLAAEVDAAYRELLKWMQEHLGAATVNGEPLSGQLAAAEALAEAVIASGCG